MLSMWKITRQPEHQEKYPQLIKLYTKGSVVYSWTVGWDLDWESSTKQNSKKLVGCILSRPTHATYHIVFQCTDGHVRIVPIPKEILEYIANNISIITDNEFDSLGDVYALLSL